MFCSNCGTPLGPAAIFCNKCGFQRALPIQTDGPPKRAKRGKAGQWFALVVVCIALYFVLGGGSSSSSSSASANVSSPASPTAPDTAGVIHKIGDSINVGYWSYRVSGTQWKSSLGSEYMNETPDAAFLILEMSIRNDDKTSSTLPPLKLVDDEGREFDESAKSWVQENSFGILKSLNPGVVSRGYAVFDVPRGHYKLKVSGGYTSSNYEFIELHK
jgi:Domain of unknown function (DUF4352)